MLIRSSINRVDTSKYTIFYQDIIKALKLLIEHKHFTHNLAYALIQQYIVNFLNELDFSVTEKGTYDKIHTADW